MIAHLHVGFMYFIIFQYGLDMLVLGTKVQPTLHIPDDILFISSLCDSTSLVCVPCRYSNFWKETYDL